MTQAQSKSYGGVKKKLMGAICMLLVASIMVVSSTYAWFTLSTAPEITGISTSVGANGNLEMALLTTATFENLDIKSAVGNSMDTAEKNITAANITWGNLVNLDDASYGLSDIKLMPARLSKSTTIDGATDVSSFLKIASYGADGRVTNVDGGTVSAIKNGDKGFQYAGATPTYGVRAIGVAGNMTQRQITFNSAKGTVASAATNAGEAFRSAVAGNLTKLVLAAMTKSETFNDEQIQAMKDVANGAKTTLERITNAYAQAALAAAAAKDSGTTDTRVETLKAAVTGITSASTLKEGLNKLSVNNYDTALTNIAAAQTSVDNALAALNGDDHTAATLKEKAAKPLVGDSSDMKAYKANGEEIAVSADNIEQLLGATELYIYGAVVKTIAEETGNLTLGQYASAMAYAGEKANAAKAGNLSDLNDKVGKLNAPVAEEDVASTISETYGYALDMAFRTNAANSKLLLAGEGVQRVYQDSTNTDTKGKGSTMTFTAEDGMKLEAVQSLMKAIRVAFIDPKGGTIYGIATLENFTTKAEDNSTTGTLTLRDYEFAADGKLTIKEGTKSAELMTLTQNQATRLTVVVWLDGDTVDNGMVANGAKSLTGSMNLQFSSDAPLQPMVNTALKNGKGAGGDTQQP